jgi:predicted acylesterase/phospholipase RssA
VHLTSYHRPRGGSDRLRVTKIWEAARATSAASSFFDPIYISIGAVGEEFVDGATGANNPVQELWNEAKDLWDPEPLESNLKCIVSIGTGVPSVEPFGTGLLDIGSTLLRISTETEKTAELFQRTHSSLDDSCRSFRFNVRNGLEKIGLEDASQKDRIMAVTQRYVESQDAFKMMRRCASILAERNCASLMYMSNLVYFLYLFPGYSLC